MSGAAAAASEPASWPGTPGYQFTAHHTNGIVFIGEVQAPAGPQRLGANRSVLTHNIEKRRFPHFFFYVLTYIGRLKHVQQFYQMFQVQTCRTKTAPTSNFLGGWTRRTNTLTRN